MNFEKMKEFEKFYLTSFIKLSDDDQLLYIQKLNEFTVDELQYMREKQLEYKASLQPEIEKAKTRCQKSAEIRNKLAIKLQKAKAEREMAPVYYEKMKELVSITETKLRKTNELVTKLNKFCDKSSNNKQEIKEAYEAEKQNVRELKQKQLDEENMARLELDKLAEELKMRKETYEKTSEKWAEKLQEFEKANAILIEKQMELEALNPSNLEAKEKEMENILLQHKEKLKMINNEIAESNKKISEMQEQKIYFASKKAELKQQNEAQKNENKIKKKEVENRNLIFENAFQARIEDIKAGIAKENGKAIEKLRNLMQMAEELGQQRDIQNESMEAEKKRMKMVQRDLVEANKRIEIRQSEEKQLEEKQKALPGYLETEIKAIDDGISNLLKKRAEYEVHCKEKLDSVKSHHNSLQRVISIFNLQAPSLDSSQMSDSFDLDAYESKNNLLSDINFRKSPVPLHPVSSVNDTPKSDTTLDATPSNESVIQSFDPESSVESKADGKVISDFDSLLTAFKADKGATYTLDDNKDDEKNKRKSCEMPKKAANIDKKKRNTK